MTAALANKAAAGIVDHEVIAWITNGLAAYQRGNDLTIALGLDRANRIREHNAAIREAAAMIREQFPQLSDWKVAGKLAETIRHFERRILPMLAIDPDRTLSAIEITLRRALATNHRGPRTQRKLFDLLY